MKPKRTSSKSTFTPEYDALRKRLVAMRKAAGLTQRQLGKRLKRVTHSFVVKAEKGDRRVDVVAFFWFCLACGLPPEKEFAALARELAAIRKAAGKGAP